MGVVIKEVLCIPFQNNRFIPRKAAIDTVNDSNYVNSNTTSTSVKDPRAILTLSRGLIDYGIAPFSQISLSICSNDNDNSEVVVQGLGVAEVSKRLSNGGVRDVISQNHNELSKFLISSGTIVEEDTQSQITNSGSKGKNKKNHPKMKVPEVMVIGVPQSILAVFNRFKSKAPTAKYFLARLSSIDPEEYLSNQCRVKSINLRIPEPCYEDTDDPSDIIRNICKDQLNLRAPLRQSIIKSSIKGFAFINNKYFYSSIKVKNEDVVFKVERIDEMIGNTDHDTATTTTTDVKYWAVDENTVIENVEIIERKREENSNPEQEPIGKGYQIIGGMKDTIDLLKKFIVDPLLYPKKYLDLGLKVPKGLLLHGPPGTGKTLLCRCTADHVKATANSLGILLPEIVVVIPSELNSSANGTVGSLSSIITSARLRWYTEKKSTLLIIDEIDVLCPNRSESVTEEDRKVVGILLSALDGVEQSDGLFILGTTNRPNSLDPALRRAGRFDKEIEVNPPNPEDRKAILISKLSRVLSSKYNSDNFDEWPASIKDGIIVASEESHAFTGADLKDLVETALSLCNEELSSSGIVVGGPDCWERYLTKDNIIAALNRTSPSAMREIQIESPNVHWDDIGGYEEVKNKLKECVEWPQKYSKLFTSLHINPPRGVLLYGPPGCSKTLMAKAVATESRRNFLSVKGPELFDKYVGESEAQVRKLFLRARNNAPSVIFIDEIDAMGSSRTSSEGGGQVESRVLAQMLTEMDGVGSRADVIVIGATNRPDILDTALTRPGRLDRLVYVGLPDVPARQKIFEIYCKNLVLTRDNVELSEEEKIDSYKELSLLSDGYSGAEIKNVVNESVLELLRTLIREREEKEFDGDLEDERISLSLDKIHHCLSLNKPRTTESQLKFYRDYSQSK